MEPITRRSVEYSLSDHCNLSCYGCDHASPLLPRSFAELESFRADLAALRGVLRVEKLYLIGGEPLLNRDIVAFADLARSSDVARAIVLVTNGVLLHQAPDALWELLSGIDVTLYPGIRLQMPIGDMVAKGLRHRVTIRIRRSLRFRRTLLNHRVNEGALVQAIYDSCRISHDYGCHSVYNGKYYKCSVAPYLAKRLQLTHTSAEGWENDGVPLRDNPTLRADLERYLSDTTPLVSCAYCLGTSGYWTAHHQTNAVSRKAWLLEDDSDLSGLVDRTKLDRPILSTRKR